MATRSEKESAAGGGKLYYSISEVAELLNVKAHVLRYWETQFKMLRPKKNRAGNRSYRVKDVKMALRIKKLLYDEGFTIAGARRKLLDERRSGAAQTELDFVGISRDDLLKMLKQDLGELILVLRGEIPLESLGRREDAPGEGRARRGIFRDLDLGAGEETEDEGDLDLAAGETPEIGFAAEPAAEEAERPAPAAAPEATAEPPGAPRADDAAETLAPHGGETPV